MSSFYAEILNHSGVSIGFGDVFQELRKYHHQELLDDEVAISLRGFTEAPVSTSGNCDLLFNCLLSVVGITTRF